MFVHYHLESIRYVKKLATSYKKMRTSRVNKLKIMFLKNAKCPGYCFLNSKEYIGRF